MPIHVQTPEGKVLSFLEKFEINQRREIIDGMHKYYNDLMDRYMLSLKCKQPFAINPYEETERGEE